MSRNKEAKMSLEEKERYLTMHAPWLGGMLEVGGGMGFTTYVVKGKLYTYPYIQIMDNVSEHAETLKNQIVQEGRIVYLGNSTEFKVEGSTAALIGKIIKRYAPSRLGIISVFENWLNTSGREERQELAESIKATIRSVTEEETYRILIENPNFLAGVLDGRGKVHKEENGSSRFLLHSPNKNLLLALMANFGGSVKTVENKSETYHWKIFNSRNIKELYAHARPGLKYIKKASEIL